MSVWLPQKQVRALEVLGAGGSRAEAGLAAGVSKRCVFLWLKDPYFQAEFRLRRGSTPEAPPPHPVAALLQHADARIRLRAVEALRQVFKVECRQNRMCVEVRPALLYAPVSVEIVQTSLKVLGSLLTDERPAIRLRAAENARAWLEVSFREARRARRQLERSTLRLIRAHRGRRLSDFIPGFVSLKIEHLLSDANARAHQEYLSTSMLSRRTGAAS